jgi:hypothetical protein
MTPRSIYILFLAAAFLVAPAALPSAFVSAIAPGLSGSAQAAINLNSSRSNNYRKNKTGKNKTGKNKSSTKRMGGGGGVSKRMGGGGGRGGARMGGGGGGRTK